VGEEIIRHDVQNTEPNAFMQEDINIPRPWQTRSVSRFKMFNSSKETRKALNESSALQQFVRAGWQEFEAEMRYSSHGCEHH
jgi:hypothetical protein